MSYEENGGYPGKVIGTFEREWHDGHRYVVIARPDSWSAWARMVATKHKSVALSVAHGLVSERNFKDARVIDTEAKEGA